MLKRTDKRNIRETFSKLFFIFVLILIIGLLFLIVKSVVPIIGALNKSKQTDIIMPLGNQFVLSDFKKMMDEKNITVESIKEGTASSVIIAKVKDGPLVYFSKDHDLSWQVMSLKLINTRMLVDNKKPVLIDLRYSKPIVKF